MEASRPDKQTAETLRSALETLLNTHGRLHLGGVILPCILELATNARKANMKHAFFVENAWDILHDAEYQIHLARFRKEILNGESMWAWSEKATQIGLTVRIIFDYDEHGLRIEVVNNLPIIAEDERRIRERFALAMKYESLAQFYLDHGDTTEGEGLGFALAVLLLKNENISPSLLRVGCEGDQTVARLEIPFTSQFRRAR